MNYEVKKVEIGTFNSINPTGIVQTGKHIYNAEKNITRDIICIIDEENEVAIDINDFNKKYKILKRNKYNQILPNQDIVENKEYALNLKNLKPEDINILEKIKYNFKISKYDKEQGKIK
jgi:hypothetical protein